MAQNVDPPLPRYNLELESIPPSVRVIQQKYAQGARSKVRDNKKFELNGIGVMRHNCEELVN